MCVFFFFSFLKRKQWLCENRRGMKGKRSIAVFKVWEMFGWTRGGIRVEEESDVKEGSPYSVFPLRNDTATGDDGTKSFGNAED